LEVVFVALDRQSIEKKDFPVGRRGYDPDAVDAHLVMLADEIAELKRSSRKRSDTLASSASEQVRAIVEAAETSAADIQREAESDAREIREEATAEAQTTREQATDEARGFVGKVSTSADSMIGRLSSMQTELDTLMETLRGGAGRLSEDLSAVQSDLLEVRGVVVPRPPFEPEVTYAPVSEVFYEAEPAAGYEPEPGTVYETETEFVYEAEPGTAYAAETGAVYEAEPGLTYESEGEVAPVDAGWEDSAVPDDPSLAETEAAPGSTDADGDAEGARLIALNMALNGTPRGDTARYLDENFDIGDSGGLLDEVYANVEG
jgi:DivIVA domain-containing protein